MRALFATVLCACLMLGCIADRQFAVLEDEVGWNPQEWMAWVNGSYDSVGNRSYSLDFGGGGNPQMVIFYAFSIPANSSTVGGVYINSTSEEFFFTKFTNLGGTSPAFFTSQGVLSPCEVGPPRITATLSVVNYTYFGDGATPMGYIQGGIQPAYTQIFGDFVSGVQTAYCCETYLTFSIPADGHTYDISILLATIGTGQDFPFSFVCIKKGFCPLNPTDSCIYMTAIGSKNTSFNIEVASLEAGDYYVRLETPITQTLRQQYNLTATMKVHESPSFVRKHKPYLIGGIAGGVGLLVVALVIVLVIYFKKRSGYSSLN